MYWSKQLHPSSQFLSFSIHPIAVPMAKRPVRACNSCRRSNLSLHSHQSITTHVHSDPKPPPAVQVWTDLQNPFPTYHRERDSWKITLRGWSPTINQTLPGPTRSHAPEHHIHRTQIPPGMEPLSLWGATACQMLTGNTAQLAQTGSEGSYNTWVMISWYRH